MRAYAAERGVGRPYSECAVLRFFTFVLLFGFSACAGRTIVPQDLRSFDGRVVIGREEILVVFPRVDRQEFVVNEYECGASWNLGFEIASDTAFSAGKRGEPFRLFALSVFAEGVAIRMSSLESVREHAGEIRACSDGGHFRTCAEKIPGSTRIIDGRITWRLARTPAMNAMLARKPRWAAMQINVNCEPPVRSRLAIHAGI